jgi:histidinol-phosphate/aromatic aminotransferase/cobyric acid decarboxylase-like protein
MFEWVRAWSLAFGRGRSAWVLLLDADDVLVARRCVLDIAALAGMRLGYAVAPSSLIERMRPYTVPAASTRS